MYPLGNAPLYVAVGDYNTDGISDVAAFIQSANTVNLLMSSGCFN